MKCSHCQKEIKNELEMKLLNADGDFACNEKCKQKYIKARDHFFNNVVHSSEKTEAWLLGKIS